MEGTVVLAEVSGAAQIPGDRLVVVSDEKGLGVVKHASKALKDGELGVERVETEGIDDLEDVTWDAEQDPRDLQRS